MKYCSIDIETTGLRSETCQILQIGAVIEDTRNVLPLNELPTFSCIIEHEVYTGYPVALNMNSWIFEILGSLERASKEERMEIRKANHIMGVGLVSKAMNEWLIANGIEPKRHGTGSPYVEITVAGKNFASFDKKFLEKLPGWSNYIQIKQRIIDPATLFMNWQTDEALPNLNTCLKRAKLDGEVTHDAIQDAIDVVRVIRAATNNYQNSL